MITIVIDNPVFNCQVIPVFTEANQPSTNSNVYSGNDVWEFIDENELANEMTASASNTFSNVLTPDIAPDDFEKLYQWFLS